MKLPRTRIVISLTFNANLEIMETELAKNLDRLRSCSLDSTGCAACRHPREPNKVKRGDYWCTIHIFWCTVFKSCQLLYVDIVDSINLIEDNHNDETVIRADSVSVTHYLILHGVPCIALQSNTSYCILYNV